MNTSDYRPDIDGLRAVAVLGVVLFHLKVAGLDGGYVGVDVFFTISGFLICSILERDIAAGKFTFLAFYLRRARRLLPAALVTIAATFAASAVLLQPADFIAFARSAIGAALSASNFVFWSEAGYWDANSELKPLLHTWSLGVEEQFYLLAPAALLLALSLWQRKRLWLVYAGVLLVGLLASEWAVRVASEAAFYLMPFRIFQFAAGALAAHAATHFRLGKAGAECAVAAGLLLIVASMLLYTAQTPFPGLMAIPPTIGTMLVLVAGGKSVMAAAVLANPVAAWIGRASYSIYLVHWPVIALYRYRTGLDLSAIEMLYLGALIIALGAALHYGVERPFRQRRDDAPGRAQSAPRFIATIASVTAAMVLVSATVALSDGWAFRYPQLMFSADAIKAGMAKRSTDYRRACRLEHYWRPKRCDRSKSQKVLVFGNSHELDAYNSLNAGYPSDDRLLIVFGQTNGCEPMLKSGGRWSSQDPECQARLQAMQDPAFIAELDVIAFSPIWPFGRDNGQRIDMVRAAKAANPALRVVTFGGYIYLNEPCPKLANAAGSIKACADPDFVDYFGDTPEAEPRYSELMALTEVHIDKVGLLCPERKLERCRLTVGKVPMVWDRHHLSYEFARFLGRLYARTHPDLATDQR